MRYLQSKGQLYQQMHQAQQRYFRARRGMLVKGADEQTATELALNQVLYWERKDEINRLSREVEASNPLQTVG